MNAFSKFTELNLAESLQKALDAMGFIEPTPIQQQTVEQTLKGRDVLGCAQTGTGKTGAFGIPLVNYLLSHPDKKALILAPTRELADQINRTLQQMTLYSYDLRIALIIGGASMGPQVRSLQQGARIVVATPGRLIDLLNQRKIALGNVGILVLDEVDRMLDMGFAPQLKQIVPHLPAERQAMLFSATMPSEITQIAESYLRNPVRVTVGEKNTAAHTVEQMMIQTQQDAKQHLLLKELPKMDGKTIIFVRTQHGTERLAKAVRAAGYLADRLHGGRSHVQRKRALENFRKGEVRLLVATDIAGRGIDIDDIEYVINYDMPKSHEDYIHRIGRTGRYGRKGVALNFVTMDDLDLMRVLDPENYPSRRGPGQGQRAQGGRPEQNPGRRTASRDPQAQQRGPETRRHGDQGRSRRPEAQRGDRRPEGAGRGDRRPSRDQGVRSEAPKAAAKPQQTRQPQAAAKPQQQSRPAHTPRPKADPVDATHSKVRRSGMSGMPQEADMPKKKRGLPKLFRWE